MPRGDGTGPPHPGGRGRGAGRGMGRRLGRGQGRRMCLVHRADGSARTAGLSSSPRPTAPAEPRMFGIAKGQTAAARDPDTLRPREAARGVGHPAPVASVDEAACTLCGACQALCPTAAIILGTNAVKVDAAACCGCGACVEVCPNGAMRLS
jgi:ferredoxin